MWVMRVVWAVWVVWVVWGMSGWMRGDVRVYDERAVRVAARRGRG